MHNQSFRQIYVAKTGALLAGGTTTNLAPNQIGIFDGSTYAATTKPSYENNRSLIIGRGVNPAVTTIMSFANSYPEMTKEIKGMKITGWRGKKATNGRNDMYAVGYDGYDPNKTLFAVCGETRHLYIRLTGQYINELYSEKGLTRQFSTIAPDCSDCADNCAQVDGGAMADDLVAQINSDEVTSKFMKAKKLFYCTNYTAPTATTYHNFTLEVTDGGMGDALGLIQAQYPSLVVSYIGHGAQFINSVYQAVTQDTGTTTGGVTTYAPTQPAAFTNNALTLIPDCNACPEGYTSVGGGYAYRIIIIDNGVDKTAEVQAINHAVAGSARRISTQFGLSTYTVIFSQMPVAADITTFQGTEATAQFYYISEAAQYCILTTPGTIAWVEGDELSTYGQDYTLSVAGACGTNRLANVQAAFPNLTIVLDNTYASANGCIFRYKTTVQSSMMDNSCAVDLATWVSPDPFEGIVWEQVIPTPNVNSQCSYGIEITVGAVDRVTGQCTYGYWAQKFDTVHIQISEFNPDYNGDPNQVAWPISKIQSLQYPIGQGTWIREQEKWSLSYQLREFSLNPIINENEGMIFAADPFQFYDEYTLEYTYSYKSGGPGEYITDPYHLQVYFPTGQGKNFENAINGYISAAQIGLNPVIL